MYSVQIYIPFSVNTHTTAILSTKVMHHSITQLYSYSIIQLLIFKILFKAVHAFGNVFEGVGV